VFTIQFIREFARLGAPEPPPTSVQLFDPLSRRTRCSASTSAECRRRYSEPEPCRAGRAGNTPAPTYPAHTCPSTDADAHPTGTVIWQPKWMFRTQRVALGGSPTSPLIARGHSLGKREAHAATLAQPTTNAHPRHFTSEPIHPRPRLGLCGCPWTCVETHPWDGGPVC